MDETEQKAFIAIAAALVAGAGPLQALAAGNVVLIGDDHEPLPAYTALVGDDKGDQL